MKTNKNISINNFFIKGILMNTFTPLYDRILIKRKEDIKEVTTGGIIIPGCAQEKSQEGTVISIGKGKIDSGKLISPSVKIGDNVLFIKQAGIEIKLNNIDYLILREDEILGIIN
jgi:chaperonin GroES